MKTYTMKAQDFYDLLETQDYHCNLSGRELRPDCTAIVHVVPLAKGGKHVRANFQLVHTDIATLARQHTRKELLALCQDVLFTIGGVGD